MKDDDRGGSPYLRSLSQSIILFSNNERGR